MDKVHNGIEIAGSVIAIASILANYIPASARIGPVKIGAAIHWLALNGNAVRKDMTDTEKAVSDIRGEIK